MQGVAEWERTIDIVPANCFRCDTKSYGENQFLFEMDAGGDRGNVVATFTKNEKGEVNGTDMQHIRMMHHRFDKQ